MSRHRRKKGEHQQKKKKHTVYFPQVGLVILPPSRESPTPFCAYYGPDGQTCSEERGLQEVSTLPCRPPITFLACPLHYEAVHQMVQAFLARLHHGFQQG